MLHIMVQAVYVVCSDLKSMHVYYKIIQVFYTMHMHNLNWFYVKQVDTSIS